MANKLLNKYKNMPAQVRASFWFVFCVFMQKGISVITTPIFTRLLSPSEYGAYSVFNSWLTIIAIFVSLHMYASFYVQGLVKFSDDQPVFSSSMQGLTLTLVVIWTAVYACFHNFFNNLFELTTVQMLAMLVMIWCSAAFNFWAAEQRVKLNYVSLVAVTLVASALKPAVGILFVLHAEDKVTARILGLALVEVVMYTVFFFIQMKKGKKFFSKKYWKYALVFNIPLIPHYLSDTILNNADRIMIKSMVGESEAGIYSLAYSLSLLMTLFNQAIMQAVAPWIFQKIKEKDPSKIAKVGYTALGLLAFANVALIALAPEVIAVFAPAKYYDAIPIIPPVSMSVYFMFASELFSKFEFYYEKTHYTLITTISAAIVNIVLNYFCIKQFGYYAAGYTTLFCYVTTACAHYFFMKRIVKKYMDNVRVFDLKVLLSLTVGFMVFGFSFLFTYNYPVVRYSIIAVMVILVIVFRKKIIRTVKSILSLKKKKKIEEE